MTAPHEESQPVPGVVVFVLAALLLVLAALAFILSFQQIRPVMLLGAWDQNTAWMGPFVIDLAAVAGGIMSLTSRNRRVIRWGRGLLFGSTALSIAGNLAGHAITVTDGGRPRTDLPEGMAGWAMGEDWNWVILLISVAMPVFVAVLTHAFGHVLMDWLSARPAKQTPLATPAAVAEIEPAATRAGAEDPVEVTDRQLAEAMADLQRQAVVAEPEPAEEVSSPTESATVTPIRNGSARQRAIDWFLAAPERMDQATGAEFAEATGCSRSKISQYRADARRIHEQQLAQAN